MATWRKLELSFTVRSSPETITVDGIKVGDTMKDSRLAPLRHILQGIQNYVTQGLDRPAGGKRVSASRDRPSLSTEGWYAPGPNPEDRAAQSTHDTTA